VAKGVGRDAVLTTDYETTAWLRFYAPGLTVVQLDQTYRYPDAPAPTPAMLRQPMLYVAEDKRDQSALVRRYFGTVAVPIHLPRLRGATFLATYTLYPVARPRVTLPARTP
jgi:hypothetical protein